MIDLPKWIPPSNNGQPIEKKGRVQRKTEKAAKKAAEDQQIVEAVKASKPKRKAIGARLRAMVLERDKFACVKCGQVGTPENPLQIGHKVPVCQGGTNDEDNLQSECRECNVGAGGRRVVVDAPPPKPELTAEAIEWQKRKDKQVQGVVAGVKKVRK